MGLEYDLSKITELEQLKELKLRLVPRNQCRHYAMVNGGKAMLIGKEEFDLHLRNREFLEGPYEDSFGDGWNEPYNPNRQAFGKLTDGTVVYCELSQKNREQTQELLSKAQQKSAC